VISSLLRQFGGVWLMESRCRLGGGFKSVQLLVVPTSNRYAVPVYASIKGTIESEWRLLTVARIPVKDGPDPLFPADFRMAWVGRNMIGDGQTGSLRNPPLPISKDHYWAQNVLLGQESGRRESS